MATPDEARRREDLRRQLRGDLDSTIEARLDRYLEVEHQGIVPSHHFAAASAECLELYRDGYLLSAIMVSQAVAEGVWRLILERNELTPEFERPGQARVLVEQGLLSAGCAEAFSRIWRSFRNDVHHMNPAVREVPIRDLAKRNLLDLAKIEREIFGVRLEQNTFVPVQPKYWDLRSDGTVSVLLRHPWIAG